VTVARNSLGEHGRSDVTPDPKDQSMRTKNPITIAALLATFAIPAAIMPASSQATAATGSTPAAQSQDESAAGAQFGYGYGWRRHCRIVRSPGGYTHRVCRYYY
jgi:hypothetical protein